jgi:hypothetical protein
MAVGSIVALGYDNGSVPAPNRGFIAVAGGAFHALGLKADGSIVAWGLNNEGQCDVPAPNADFIAIAGGGHHSLGRKADGSIVAWGRNDYGQCNVPAPSSGSAALAVGDYHSLALKSGVPAAGVTAAVSRRACDLNLSLSGSVTSEPRQGGASEVRITFDTAPSGPGSNPVSIDERLCPLPGSYGPYTGASAPSASIEGNELVLTFTPALENGRTYRLTLGPDVTSIAGQFVEVRALQGDVNSDGQVNGTDRSVIVSEWTGGGFTCATDVSNGGVTNATDRSIVIGSWTGTENCAP